MGVFSRTGSVTEARLTAERAAAHAFVWSAPAALGKAVAVLRLDAEASALLAGSTLDAEGATLALLGSKGRE